MPDPDSSSTWKWALGLLVAVPAAWLAVLQISDRHSDDAAPQTTTPTTSQMPSTTAVQEPPSIPVVDGIRIETSAYDEAGPNTYVADTTGGKKIRVSWTSSAGGYEVNGGCASSVRIQGPDTDLAKNAPGCSDAMGTDVDVQQPGNYTVTVTTRQDSGAEHSESVTVTVLPG